MITRTKSKGYSRKTNWSSGCKSLQTFPPPAFRERCCINTCQSTENHTISKKPDSDLSFKRNTGKNIVEEVMLSSRVRTT